MEATRYKYYLPNDIGTNDYNEWKKADEEYRKASLKRIKEQHDRQQKLDECRISKDYVKEMFHATGSNINEPLKGYYVITYKDFDGNIVEQVPFNEDLWKTEIKKRESSFIFKLKEEIHSLYKYLDGRNKTRQK